MNVSLFLKIKSVISVFSGLGMVFLYAYLMPIYGITLNSVGILFAQWSGAGLFGIGLICWYAAQAEKSDLRQGILLALFLCDSIGFAVSLMAQLAGVVNVLGWSTVGLWLILALGLGYFRFLKQGD